MLTTIIVAILILNTADFVLSYLMLKQRWMEEGNPIAAYVWKRWGFLGLVIYKYGLIAVAGTLVAYLLYLGEKEGANLVVGVAFGAIVVTVYQVALLYLFLKQYKDSKPA